MVLVNQNARHLAGNCRDEGCVMEQELLRVLPEPVPAPVDQVRPPAAGDERLPGKQPEDVGRDEKVRGILDVDDLYLPAHPQQAQRGRDEEFKGADDG